VSAPTRGLRTERIAAVTHVPFGAAGKLVVGNLALQTTTDGVVWNVRYFPVAAITGLPVRSVRDFVSKLVSGRYAAWSGSAEGELHLALPTAETGWVIP